MDDRQLDDLKQFITATVSQTEKRLEVKIAGEITGLRSELKYDIAKLRSEMADGFSGIGEAIEHAYDLMDKRHTEIDTRLTKLECQAA